MTIERSRKPRIIGSSESIAARLREVANDVGEELVISELKDRTAGIEGREAMRDNTRVVILGSIAEPGSEIGELVNFLKS